ncbi:MULTISPECIES: DUF4192 domain-containing protein [Streptomycetaceae]|uniref:DUF4192 domain-containing protein n=1 Tax=Streptantibioticus cattleyicolor (strain ATCC 35852 / DSM 46488 / JCM 4925 / NBRC 14057 / NRRL 8057) TaxID=1003195 RepID=F8JVP5_STREN|nr:MULTISPECIES: DUF4192 domain-containing protein [Streptomycetaceae]AEW96955.1 hypothetical protein SCATT_45840 [Streptantibioticus cattleyicolor NRRL 8057 = DSM 46488]MYS61427.1 DUF4192 family protein [Streptomyces sp. SID5468]CCB77282.1 conserved protein of unknown function [Streptantibioticus cattleyicolor NRRL 8057 = DSM 46488]
MTQHTQPTSDLLEPHVTLRTPAQLAEALPYLLGFHPDDSIVLIAMHGGRGRFGGRLRIGIPESETEWPHLAAELADCLVNAPSRFGRPNGIAAFLCQDPRGDETPARTMERLRPLAQHLRTACGAQDVPVFEALCVSGGRWFSYCCPNPACCPPEGGEINRDGTSVMAVAAAYAGIRVRGSLREMRARFAPLTGARSEAQETALDTACGELVPRMLDGGAGSGTVREETIALAAAALQRFKDAPAEHDDPTGDAHDDTLLGDEEAAAVLIGLQDRDTRDIAAEWQEECDQAAALRLWRALARRCVGAYAGYAAPPLTLAGLVCWLAGDEPSARVAFGLALEADPDYVFAQLLHEACNHHVDPEPLRRRLREEHAKRSARPARPPRPGRAGTGPKGRPSGDTRPVTRTTARPRTRRRVRADGDERA